MNDKLIQLSSIHQELLDCKETILFLQNEIQQYKLQNSGSEIAAKELQAFKNLNQELSEQSKNLENRIFFMHENLEQKEKVIQSLQQQVIDLQLKIQNSNISLLNNQLSNNQIPEHQQLPE